MKKILLATAATVLLSAPAMAAPYNGFYLGASAGYGTGDANQTRFGAVGGPFVSTQNDASIDGWTFGVLAGHNWTVGGNVVLGLEGNWDFGGPSGDDGGSGGDINEWEQSWEASLRARLGLLVTPSTLIYGTVGYSWAEYDANVLNAPVSSRSHTFADWTYGAGIETQLTPSMTARFQYRHTDYSAERVTFAPAELYDIEAGPSTDHFSIGIAFHL
ncbi:MAG: outer membrane beta-barrel protein [Micropepsaceae bacterium]